MTTQLIKAATNRRDEGPTQCESAPGSGNLVEAVENVYAAIDTVKAKVERFVFRAAEILRE
jgi:hypothetical protein